VLLTLQLKLQNAVVLWQVIKMYKKVIMNLLNVDKAELGYWRSAIYIQHQADFAINSSVIPQSRITKHCQM